jgi:hypothetical protein
MSPKWFNLSLDWKTKFDNHIKQYETYSASRRFRLLGHLIKFQSTQ